MYFCTFSTRGKFDERRVAVEMIPLEESRYTRQELELMKEADDHRNIARLFVSTKDHQFHYIAFSSFDFTLWEVLHCLALVHSVRRKESSLTLRYPSPMAPETRAAHLLVCNLNQNKGFCGELKA